MSADLLPCPFCGSANVGEPIRRRPLQVACIDCGGEGPEAHTVDEARTAWNDRAALPGSYLLRFDPFRPADRPRWTLIGPAGRIGDYHTLAEAMAAIPDAEATP